MFQNFRQYGFCLLQYVVIPEPQYAVALFLQKFASLLIIKLLVSVLPAVQFDD